jgi:hypothetical protein
MGRIEVWRDGSNLVANPGGVAMNTGRVTVVNAWQEKAEANAQKRSNEMRIKTIPRAECAPLQPLHAALESLMGEQVEWFSNQVGKPARLCCRR